MPHEVVGDREDVVTADHPPRTDSPAYRQTRRWLMESTAGGCYVCGGPVDLSHPGGPAGPSGLQDHHGGGLFLVPDHGDPILVGFNLFGLEWSLGFGANPERVDAFVAQVNEVAVRLGGKPYAAEIGTTEDVMAWVDSPGNASVKLCAAHHVAHEDEHTPDANGNEAVGIHNGPFPIWLGQATCDWARFDMWGGTTGTVAVAHPGDSSGTAHVLYVSPLHPDTGLYALHKANESTGSATVLPAHHPIARLAHAGSHRA